MVSSLAGKIDIIRQILPSRARLIAVTKQVPSEVIRQAYAAGLRDFGESFIQEATIKQAQLQDLSDINWHFIGHLQSNKVKIALKHFSWIHSIDNIKIALILNQLADQIEKKPNILLQVKLLSDPNKYGFSMSDLLTILPVLNDCKHLNIKGLMTISPLDLDSKQTLDFFEQTRTFAEKIQAQNWSNLQMHELCMGMSRDYSLALQAGATMIRVGQFLFGVRQTAL